LIKLNALRILFALLLTCTCGYSYAQIQEISISQPSNIQSSFQFIADTSSKLLIDNILTIPDKQWQTELLGSTNFGITTAPYWLRFNLKNTTEDSLILIAALDYSQLDDVIFYEFMGVNKLRELATGDTRPFYPRDVDHPIMSLRIKIEPDQVKTIYIRIQTDGSMILPLRILPENLFFSEAAKEQKLHFFYFGCLTVIILINFAVFLTLREKLYLFYALAIAGYLLFFTSISGYSFQHLYPQYPIVHERALLISMPLLAFFSVLFCREFLHTKKHSPKLDIALRAMMYFEVFNFFSALFLSYNTAIMISAISALFFFSILFVAGPISWAAGKRAGIFFTAAWTPLTVGVLATAGRSLGFFPENFMTQYAMQIGSGLEAFILTLALADRLYHEREDKIEAQADSLRKEKARHIAQRSLAEAMVLDPNTRLPNRNRFEWMVNKQIQQNPNGRYLIGVTRITRIDEINRTLGLTRSERLLKHIAKQMTELAKNIPSVHKIVDTSGREERVYQISGDCFGVLINSNALRNNFDDIKETLKKICEPVVLDNLAIDLHPKFGVAAYPNHGENAAVLIRNAHVGMEIAPHTMQEVGFYSEDYDIYSESRLTLMSDLREALLNNQTELYYQPKVNLITGEIIGLEALIRWHHPERGRVFPDEFIPLAEETGLITIITKWAFEQGIKDLASLLVEYPKLNVSINISARDLIYEDISTIVHTTLKRYQVDPTCLIIELTETAAMEDPISSLITLKELSDTGIKISIDDFGSGYSSLSYLKQLPATEIKLDRSLLIDVCSSESSKVIVATAINMAHSLGYKLVAEGIEDEESAILLKEMGCDMLQGFWLCHPLPMDKLKPWLKEYRNIF
jgi:EAL domain-containing protein (putative c-di-GMP-specific phosphodiesterase class I)/GGDEF domain-containing protein